MKYRWTYVDARGRWYLRSKSYYSFGSTLHRVLERFHDAGDEGVTTTDEVMAAYEESWIDAGFSSAEEMAEAYGDGKQILERHVEEARKRPATAKTLFVERQLKFEYEEFSLVGRVDRVDQHDDGTLEIIDYKSGRERITEEDVKSDIAMSIYQLLLRRQFPEQPVAATILALKSGESATYSMSDEELDELENDVRMICMEIIKEDFFERRAVPKPLCRHCDFFPLCLKDPDYAEALPAESDPRF